ncbi:hypothetical protein C0991_003451 [Blastosporella zonata]|nr:hypothetical protein C0991_003451 [Blastosporella zonata]
MSRQDKATTEKFTRTLRELVKHPENKVCADCKRNGIHRGMGTHISKVKSVDLDTWTPEQMEVSFTLLLRKSKLRSRIQSIQKWGNHLANLYWEAHLKPGHVPPEHKMESFVRSKYESRRWALEGPPPTNPSDLENGAQAKAPAPQQQQQAPVASRSHASTANTSTRVPAATTTLQAQAHRLISSNYTSNPSQGVPTNSLATAQRGAAAPTTVPAAATPPKAPENDLFSLDFHAPSPAPAAPEGLKKDVKQDILSLFSSPPPASAPAASAFGQFSATPAASPWATQAAAPSQQQATSMLGTSGVGAWGATSGWGAPAPAPPTQGNLWGAPGGSVSQQQQSGLFNTTAVWGSSPPAAPVQDASGLFAGSGSASGVGSTQPKKDDVFGDLWGGFK